ncbi:MAG: hypothetical protein KDB82_11555 [Planctomycetes bacterium]|nr:hypothetical protein [Planctomycetota bacterium]
MSDDILLTCQSIDFEDGYPVLRKVFRHMARTPESYVIWIEPSWQGPIHILLQYSNGHFEHHGDRELTGAGNDYFAATPPVGFEGAVEVVIVDATTGNARASRIVHFGGLS